jgi:hypothetical protein
MSDKNIKTTATRRQFIAVGSMAVVGLATAGRSGATESDVELPTALSVGYWDGLYSAPGAGTPTAHILRAESLSSDTLFRGTGALIRMRGFWIAPQRRFTPYLLSLIALYPAIDPETGTKVPFVAWSYAYRGAAGPLSSNFIVPVDSQNRLQLVVDRSVRISEVPTPTAGAEDRARLRQFSKGGAALTFGLRSSPLVLRSGYYFIALRDRVEQPLPPWQSIRVADFRTTDTVKPDGDGILFAGGSPVDFDYVVLSIEPYGVTAPEFNDAKPRTP